VIFDGNCIEGSIIHNSITPDSYLGKISDYFYLNNRNNQLEN